MDRRLQEHKSPYKAPSAAALEVWLRNLPTCSLVAGVAGWKFAKTGESGTPSSLTLRGWGGTEAR